MRIRRWASPALTLAASACVAIAPKSDIERAEAGWFADVVPGAPRATLDRFGPPCATWEDGRIAAWQLLLVPAQGDDSLRGADVRVVRRFEAREPLWFPVTARSAAAGNLQPVGRPGTRPPEAMVEPREAEYSLVVVFASDGTVVRRSVRRIAP